ncbi:retrotransposon protein, putative, ty1-copia subclass [Tanacetum coccineum]
MLEKHQLTGPNFNEWLRALKLVVRTEKLQDVFETPLPPAPAASADNQALADWNALFDRHNEVACLMLGTMSPKLYQQFENKSPQEMITELQKMYGKPPGVELQELVNMFHSCKQAEGQSVSDHVLLMKSYLDQLATLNYAFPDKVSISFILNSLSSEFQAFVQNYNMQSMEKTISEVHSLLIEFEKSIKRNKQQIVGASSTPHVMAIQSGRVQKNKPQGKAKGKEKGKGLKNSYPTKPKKPQPYKKERPAKDGQCHHCKEEGHWKRNCPLYLAELMKKKKTGGQNVASTSSGIYTIELFAFPKNSWVYDTGCGTHICNTKQGLRGAKKLKRGSLYLYVGNGVRAEVEAIGSFDLVLPNGLIIVLDNCHYAPSITRGVVSVSRLVNKGFTQCFTDFGLSVSMNNMIYFNAITVNGIYEIDMRDSTLPIVNSMYSISNKRTKPNLDSSYLWHCRLAHINKKRIEKLQHDGLLKPTDNEPFDQCVSCISGKMTRKPFSHKTEKVKDVLGLIHTDVCGPLRHVSKKGASYFITFTDDYSRYGYVYLLKHKHEVFETFKVFKNEVENQLGKTIKAIRSDRGGEYISQEFKDYLKAYGIVQQLTPPYTPQHNGVSERRNRTLLNMVRSMMSLTTLPLSFWDYALESAARILNMVPTKKVDKTPYELWHGKVPNLSYLKVWGCEAHVKRHTPDKLQQRSVKCIFVGYPKETMGYYFYYPPENKIVVERYADFLEKDFILQKESGRNVELDDEDILPSENTSEHPIEEESLAPIVSQEEDVVPVRRSVRTHKAPNRLCLNVEIDPDRLSFNIEVEEHSLGDLNEPANYKAALSDPEFEKWLVAMNEEMQSMNDNKVWKLVVLLPNAKVVKSKWIYKKKTNMDGKRIVLQWNSPKRLGKDAKGNTIVHPPVSLDEHVAVQRENKVRTLLLQALPEDHMPDFHHYDDARDIWMAVKIARFQKFRAVESSAAWPDNDDITCSVVQLEIGRIGNKVEMAMLLEALTDLRRKAGLDDKARYSAFKVTEVKTDEPKALVSVDSMVNWSDHAAENKTGEVEKVYGMMAGLHTDNGGAGVSDAAAEFALIGWKEPSRILNKLINSSMSTRTKIGLGFKEYFREEEVFDLSRPSTMYPEPVGEEVKPLYHGLSRMGDACSSSIHHWNLYTHPIKFLLPCKLTAASVPAGCWNSSESVRLVDLILLLGRN